MLFLAIFRFYTLKSFQQDENHPKSISDEKVMFKTNKKAKQGRESEIFATVVNIRYSSENSLCSQDSLCSEDFSLFPTFLIFSPALKFSLKLQKLIQDKLRKIAENGKTS